MTTNVFDRKVREMATDSRWSVVNRGHIFYLDNPGFEKIEVCAGHAFMFAGDADRIEQWKTWLRSEPADDSGMPPTDRMAVCMASVPDGAEKFCVGADIKKPEAVFAGTGSIHACNCWVMNGDARRAVETAKAGDYMSGGQVKYFEFATGNHNLVLGFTPITAVGLTKLIMERGEVMAINNTTGVPFPRKKTATASANESLEEIVADTRAKLASGELKPCAPCDGMHNEWTQEEKDRFRGALGEAFGWKQRA